MKEFIALIVLAITLPIFVIIAILASFIGQSDAVIDGYQDYICSISDSCEDN